MHVYPSSPGCNRHELWVQVEPLASEITMEMFKVLASPAGDIKQASRSGKAGPNGVSYPYGFPGIVLVGVREVVETGHPVVHRQSLAGQIHFSPVPLIAGYAAHQHIRLDSSVLRSSANLSDYPFG